MWHLVYIRDAMRCVGTNVCVCSCWYAVCRSCCIFMRQYSGLMPRCGCRHQIWRGFMIKLWTDRVVLWLLTIVDTTFTWRHMLACTAICPSLNRQPSTLKCMVQEYCSFAAPGRLEIQTYMIKYSRNLTCRSNSLKGVATDYSHSHNFKMADNHAILSLTLPITNHSEAGRQWSPMMCRAVCVLD